MDPDVEKGGPFLRLGKSMCSLSEWFDGRLVEDWGWFRSI